ncbi:hypothetical protein ABZX85_50135 [Streptomyces sp. NPDC004539]|uniref:hypothetical protein n=1 Tax=Streptomyces sp. NPDC004539 TaxID=3154280 RepID=UPI0033BB09BA
MISENSYGSRPDYLPGFVSDIQGGGDRQIRLLNHVESRELEAVSLNRFPATTGAALDWEAVPFEGRMWWEDEEDWARMAAEILAPYVRDGRQVAVFWGNLVMSTVIVPAALAVQHAREILDAAPHFWIYPLSGSVLVECLSDGQVTVAKIPPM